MQTEQKDEEAAASEATSRAMRDLKNRELTQQDAEEMVDPTEATSYSAAGGAPYHFNKPVHRSLLEHLVTDWGTQHTARAQAGAQRPKFDTVAAQNAALAAGRATLGPVDSKAKYRDLSPDAARDFNNAYKDHFTNTVKTWERLNGIRTGITPTDYIKVGVEEAFPYGHKVPFFEKHPGRKGVPNEVQPGWEMGTNTNHPDENGY